MQRLLTHVPIILLASCLFFQTVPVTAADDINGRAFHDLGVFAYEDGDYEGALNNFLIAQQYEPDNAVYVHYLGKIYFKTDRFDQAEEAFRKAVALDPDLPDLKYDLAYLYYKRENYEKASELFIAISKDDPENVLAHYFAGICLHKLRRYAEAVDYFNTAADKSPTIKDNGTYYAGTCYYNMENLDTAMSRFEYVRNQASSETLKQNAEKYIRYIEIKKKSLKPYSLYTKIGYTFDDNVILEAIDMDLPSGKKDGALVGYFSGAYDFYKKNNYTLGAGYSHYQRRYESLREYDLMGSIGKLYAKYNMSPVTMGFSILPTHYWLDTDDYLEQYQFRPDIKYTVNEAFSIYFAYSYYIVNNLEYDEKDGYTHEATYHFNYILPKNLGLLYGGVGFETFNADHPDEDYQRAKASAGISLKHAASGVNLNLFGEYAEKDYDNEDSFYGATREDEKYYFSVSLSRKILYDWLSISVEYNHTKNDSNIMDFEYKKNVGNLSLTANL